MKNKIRTHIKLINILSCTIFLSVVLFSYESLTPTQKFTVTLFGWGNGYVVIPKGHPAHNINYGEIFVDVHGGLTFSNNVDSLNKEDFPELTNEMAGCWVVGFDTAHFGDNLENWTKERVIDETNDLRLQLGKMFLKSFTK